MKTIKILLLVTILAVTQSYALSQTQKNVLLGLGAGAIIIHALESHNNNHYDKPHRDVIYVNSRYSHRKNKRHHMRKYPNQHYSRANDYSMYHYRGCHNR